MTDTGKIMTGIIAGAIVVFALVTLIDLDVSGDLETPNVEMVGGNIELPEIETSGGEMPNVEVNTADIEMGERRTTVDVPTGIETEERTMTYPTFDYESADDGDNR